MKAQKAIDEAEEVNCQLTQIINSRVIHIIYILFI